MTKWNSGSDYIADKRFQLLEFLGTKCSCSLNGSCWHEGPCQVDDDRCLQIDHINGGGTQDIKRHGSNYRMIAYYLDHPEEAKRELQILCANCNWVKRDRNKETATRENKWLKRLLAPQEEKV